MTTATFVIFAGSTVVGVMAVVFTAAWKLASMMASLRQEVKDLPATLNGSILRTIQDYCRTEMDRCPARREYPTDVRDGGDQP